MNKSYPSYDKSLIAIRYWLLAKEYYTALKAMEFAMEHHVGLRKDGVTKEFHHQLSTVYYIRSIYKSILFPEATMAVAFLHDVVEDHNVQISDISTMFGEEIARAERLITRTKDKSIANYYEDMAEDPIASIVKCADRIHNVQSMIGVFNTNKQREYIKETQEHVIPMIKRARRLFPQQEPAYENAKHFLQCQVELIEEILKNEK